MYTILSLSICLIALMKNQYFCSAMLEVMYQVMTISISGVSIWIAENFFPSLCTLK